VSGPRGLSVVPVTGVPEVASGDDLAEVLLAALATSGTPLGDGDCLVVSSKVVSKALDLTWDGSREDAVASATVRVVAERVGAGGGLTRVVEAAAGPVMAAAGVDASNAGPSGAVLLLPDDPDAEAAHLRSRLLERLGLDPATPFAVVLSDTAGRPWRAGLTDFALGAAGLAVVDDLRGGVDHDGRPLAVTTRALADEVAAAADLVKGKADGIPAAVVRGLDPSWFAPEAPGARTLVRTGPGDWFALGSVEAVRSALGAAPGTREAADLGVMAVWPEPFGVRVGRVVALALLDVPDGSADVGVHDAAGTAEVTLGADGAAGTAEVTLGADDPYELGRLVTRLEVAASSEHLTATVGPRRETAVTVLLRPV
jgi:coenzyme F420-0:L-glutamate ligase/coenzyme F420-1:gamma-L-glutamate ligase